MSEPLERRNSKENLIEQLTPLSPDDVKIEVTYESKKLDGDSKMTAVEENRHLESTLNACDGDDQDTSVYTEKHLLKNMLILGTGFVFVFSAYNSLLSLQSSLFLDTGLGLHALTIVYSLMVASCLYGPVLVQKLTPNWTIVLSFVMVAVFISSFFYPRIYTLMPSAVLLGLTLGPLFCAKTTFLMQLVSQMTYLTEGIREKVRQRYLRLFYLFFSSSKVWGNLITALLLQYGGDTYVRSQYITVKEISHPGVTFPPSVQFKASPSLCDEVQCQSDHMVQNSSSFMLTISSNVSLILVCVYLCLVFLGVAMVTVFLDKFEIYVHQDPLERSLCLQTVRGIGLAFVDPHIRLMFPMIFFIGMEQGFMLADFTRSYVSCALGLESVGYTMMCMGAMNTTGALAVHQFSKHIKRPLIMAAGLIFQSGLLMVLWLWRPVRDDVAVFYVIAAGWGLCNAIWETLTMTYLVANTDDWISPFSAYFMTQACGLSTAFGISFYLCTDVKIYILSAIMVAAVIPYTLVEFRYHHQHTIRDRTAIL